MRGISWPHRGLFMSGAMFYGSSLLLWALLMTLLTLRALTLFIKGPRYFPAEPSLFPVWPMQDPRFSWSLVIITVVLLLLPKLLAIVHVLVSRQAHRHGDLARAVLSVAGETCCLSCYRPRECSTTRSTSLRRCSVKCVGKSTAGRAIQFLLQICRHLRAATILALWWGPVLYVVDRALFGGSPQCLSPCIVDPGCRDR